MGASYYKRKSAGLCVKCGHPSPDKSQCSNCRKRQRQAESLARRGTGAYGRKRRGQLKLAGMCQSCGDEPAVENRTLCSACLNGRRIAAMARRRAKSAAFEEVCRICLVPIKGAGAKLDHCHKTGVTRGWLCNPCYEGLDFFRDDPKLLLAAAAYLELDRSTHPPFDRATRDRIVLRGKTLPP